MMPALQTPPMMMSPNPRAISSKAMAYRAASRSRHKSMTVFIVTGIIQAEMEDCNVPNRTRSKDHARELAASLSLEDQVALLAGKDFWRTVSLPKRNIPSIKVTDGPNGARGEYFTDGTPAALFPCGVSLAATWDVNLIYEVGQHLAAETKARGANVLLAPTVCLHRSPLGGRNFESFSEDPLLSGKLAAAYISGLQREGVAATIKHFVGNEQETHRQTMDSKIDERTLREVYLKPFEIAIRDANPWAVMTAYSLVNGVHADMSIHNLRDILRGEWNYDGMVMSDWTGTNSVAQSIIAGCDLEMPGPTAWRGQRAMNAIEDGELSKEDVERSAANVLYLIERTKGLNGRDETPERTEDVPERRDLIRKLGHAGLTLLKNEGILPLRNEGESIAVIGPNSARAVAHGGGSASLTPYYTTKPLDSIQAMSKGPVLHAVGCETRKRIPLVTESACLDLFGEPGVTVEYYRGDDFEGTPVQTIHKNNSDLFIFDSAPEEILPLYSFKAKCILTPATSGEHSFGLMSMGPGRLFVNGKLLIDNWDWTEEGETIIGGSAEAVQKIHLVACQRVEIVVESTTELRPRSKLTPEGPNHCFGGCRVGFEEDQTVDLIEEAVCVAREADVAVVCVGLDAEWESEGYDRKTMDLPHTAKGSQDALVYAVAAANPRTVVVNQSGTPITMRWAHKVPAIIQAWYQGQEAGNALADVLFGIANPSGKLPVTFPKNIEDNPAYPNWPGENMQVKYEEGLFIGYRHYDRNRPFLFPFGHGLSYTRFEYGEAKLNTDVLQKGGRLAILVPVRNVGPVAGSETVQLYILHTLPKVQRPLRELQAFAKVHLAPGEEKEVELFLDRYAIGYYDTTTSKWTAEACEYTALIGASSRDLRTQCKFRVEEEFTWIF